MEEAMRNLNPTSPLQSKSRMLVLMLALSMLAVAAPAVNQCLAQVFAPMVRRVQAVERESRETIRFTQRLYRFYKLSTEHAAAVRNSN
jgi:hypothetical protein